MQDSAKYALRGVSATKHEVHAAIQNLDKGLFPNAFCKVLPDVLGNDPAFCNIMHADTAGTKTSLAYLYWRETGDLKVWKGIAQDAIVMNLDDMACVGCVQDVVLSSTIGRNKHLVPGEVVKAIIEGAAEFIDNMQQHGVRIHASGGETADVGDIVRTVDVGYTTFARLPRERCVVNNVKEGMSIVGFSSYGQTTYEKEYNSGIGSNGLTSARHDVLSAYFGQKYPESFAPEIPKEVAYTGNLTFADSFAGYSVSQLLLSPTRTYLPFLALLLQELPIDRIGGLIHNSGGGQTKVSKFIQDIHVIKDNLLPVPPVFQLIQEQSGTDSKEMYQVFNMGTRLETYLHDADVAVVLDMAASFGLEAQVIGHTERMDGERITLKTQHGTFEY